ncbi:MAG TPA: hypothetical protein VGH64_15830 [Puia sp.]
MRKIKYIILITGMLAFFNEACLSQAAKNNLILGLGYFNSNNQVQYLKASTKSKINGKFRPVGDIPVRYYISSEDPANLLGKAVTNDKGIAHLFIPPSAAAAWKKSAKQSFLVVSDSTKEYDGVHSNFDLTKSRIQIDTLPDRQIQATFSEFRDSVWVAVKGVDMKVTVKRLGGDLNVNETPTYTTDSLGLIHADFKLDKLPGDSAGNLTIIAEVDDNDVYGNLTTEKSVPWGEPTQYVSSYNQRSLFARRGWSPLWLEWMAYSIIAVVWGVMIYLFFQIRKLKKLA